MADGAGNHRPKFYTGRFHAVFCKSIGTHMFSSGRLTLIYCNVHIRGQIAKLHFAKQPLEYKKQTIKTYVCINKL